MWIFVCSAAAFVLFLVLLVIFLVRTFQNGNFQKQEEAQQIRFVAKTVIAAALLLAGAVIAGFIGVLTLLFQMGLLH